MAVIALCATLAAGGSSSGCALTGDYDFRDRDLEGVDPNCVPLRCETYEATCGFPSDGCGQLLFCGACEEPNTCGGGGTSFQCGCTPKECAELGAECGRIDDGCGKRIDCGKCGAGLRCGLLEPNVCALEIDGKAASDDDDDDD